MPNYEIEHQGGAIADIAVQLEFIPGVGEEDPFAYPEFVSIVNFIDDYLVNYPNETDFWEILNKNLVETLLSETIPTDFGVEYNLNEVVDNLRVDIQVQSGSSSVNYPRVSSVTQSVTSLVPEPLSNVFGTPGVDLFDSENPEDTEFIGVKQNLFTGSGNDRVDVSQALGNNRIDLGSGDDTIFAGSDNRVLAGSGNDILFLNYPEGNNVVTGGEGADQFWLVTDELDLPEQANTITDFTPGLDKIGFGATSLSFDDLTLTQVGTDTNLKALNQDLAVLLNVQVSSLDQSNFVFV